MVEPRLLGVIRPVVSTFERLEIPYYFGGSVAAILYGLPRSTLDADLSASLFESHVPTLVSAWEEDFYVSGPMIREAIQRQSSFNLIHLKTVYKVDVFCSHAQPFQQSVLSRRRDPSQVGLVSQGNETSEHQWLDILGILKLQRDALDTGYIVDWAEKLNMLDLWTRICGDAASPVPP